MKVSVFWFRRDMRLDDNTGLNLALQSGFPVLPVFIFDSDILNDLDVNDRRVSFIYARLKSLNKELQAYGSSLMVAYGKPINVFRSLIEEYDINGLYYNKDYEPYAKSRDMGIDELMKINSVKVFKSKDQVILQESEVVKNDGSPYTVFSPYKRKWLEKLNGIQLEIALITGRNFLQKQFDFPLLKDIGFISDDFQAIPYDLSVVKDYHKHRDIPGAQSTTKISTHLRFGTVSIRRIVIEYGFLNQTFLSELIWREFFMQILFHFPNVVKNSFRSKYDNILWRNNREEFNLWTKGKTGYPIVDAGMRELNTTGFMHNRVRMIVASFLTKHLLVDWRWGEAYFAQKLMDYELSSNNGNWQWAAGTGCDAAPYFRVFNPWEQQKKFDPEFNYIKKWIPEFNPDSYIDPIVEHKYARQRAIETYKQGLKV